MANEEDMAKEALEFADDAYNADRHNRQEAILDLQFLASDQWKQSDRDTREADGRPVVTINRLLQPWKQVVNDIRQSVPAVKAKPIDGKGDEKVAAVYAGLVRHIQRRSRAPWVYSQATGHAAACGIGHMRIVSQYVSDDVFDQELIIKLVTHPLSVLWSPQSVEPSRKDSKGCLVFDFVPKAEFKKRWPDAKTVDFPQQNTGLGQTAFSWARKEHVVIAEYWRIDEKPKEIALLESGEVIDMEAAQKAGAPIVRSRKVMAPCVKQVLIGGSGPLSEVTEWPGKFIPVIPVIGVEIPLEDRVVRQGLVRPGRDPQRMYNFQRSSSAEWLGLAPKSPVIMTPEEVDGFEAMWNTANTTPRPYLLYNRDSQNPQARPYREPPPQPPQALWQEANICVDEIKAATGIYDASLGAAGNETSGKAILARQREGDTANYEYGDNLKASLEHMGDVLADLIPHIYDTERTIRILDEKEREQFVPINVWAYTGDDDQPVLVHDLTAARYDIEIEIGPSQTTRRVEAAESMLEYMKVDPDAFALARDLIAENMDWPGKDEMANRFRRAMPPELLAGEQDAPQPPPPDPMMQEAAAAELEEKKAAVKEKRSKTVLNLAKAKREIAQSEMQQLGGAVQAAE